MGITGTDAATTQTSELRLGRPARRIRSTGGHRGALTAVVATVVAAMLMMGAAPAGAAGTGTISGSVTGPDVAPLAGISVELLNPVWGVVIATTSTDIGGTYSFASAATGTYRMRFVDPTGVHETRYSGGSPVWATSSTIGVATGATTVVDMSLPRIPVPLLAGHVTNAWSADLQGITVEVLNWYFGVVEATTTTGSGGNYSFAEGSLVDGPHRVRFSDPSNDHGDWYSGNSPTWSGSEVIAVTQGTTTTLDALLPPGPIPKIAGTVRHVGGGGVAGITVMAKHHFWDTLIMATTTDADGSYAFFGLPNTTFRVRFTDPARRWTDMYSGNSPTWVGSTPITVTPGVTHVEDATLPDTDPDTVTGTVTASEGGPLAGMTVELRSTLDITIASATTDGAGNYAFTGVPPHGFTLRFSDASGVRATEYAGHTITMGAPAWAYGNGSSHVVDHAMPLATDLHGRVRVGWHADPSSPPEPGEPSAAGMLAVLLEPTAFTVLAFSTTDATGTWEFPALPPGSYQVGFVHPSILTSFPGGYRPVLTHQVDVLALGIAAARAAATVLSLTSGEVDGGTQSLAGWDCDPTVFQPGASLAGADLRLQELAGCNLSGIDLAGANLSDLDLSFAVLAATDVSGADLSGTSLVGASGTAVGGASATYAATVCPDGIVTDGTTVTTCVGHGVDP